MTLKECTAILVPLVSAMRVEFDDPDYRAYHRGLEDVPLRWLQASVDRWLKGTAKFFPRVPELRATAQEERQAERNRRVFAPCDDCEQGWIEAPDAHGIMRRGRCGCWQEHQRALDTLGLAGPPLVLPPADDAESDRENHVATMERPDRRVVQQMRTFGRRRTAGAA